MFYSLLQLLSPLIGLMMNILIQLFSFRYIPRLGLLKSVYIGFTVGLFTILLLEFYLFSFLPTAAKDLLPVFTVNLIIYLSLGYCYFHFINLGETARRVRILRELLNAEKGLSMDEILERYNAKEIVELRINRLINNGQIIYKNGRYYIGKPFMLLMAKIIVLMKLIILGKRGNFARP